MTTETFRAETVAAAGTSESGSRFEITFQSADGKKMKISLPLRVAADMTTIFADLSLKVERAAGGPAFSKNVDAWQVGRSNEEPKVLLRFDDLTLAIELEGAKKLWREIREEADAISRRGPASRH